MGDPFMRASRQIIRRLGKPVVIITANGVRVDLKGVYSGPEDDNLVKGRKGGLTLKTRSATLRVYAGDAPGLSTDCRVIVPHINRDFFPADWPDDGDGCILIHLADALTDPIEGSDDGVKWC